MAKAQGDEEGKGPTKKKIFAHVHVPHMCARAPATDVAEAMVATVEKKQTQGETKWKRRGDRWAARMRRAL